MLNKFPEAEQARAFPKLTRKTFETNHVSVHFLAQLSARGSGAYTITFRKPYTHRH